MNRPDQRYCYLPDKHYKCNMKIMLAFAKEVAKEVADNADGVKMPYPFGYLKIVALSDVSVKDYYTIKQTKTRNIRFQNYHTDGLLFSFIVILKNIFSYFRMFNDCSHYLFKNSYKRIKKPLLKKIEKGEWGHYSVFKNKHDAKR